MQRNVASIVIALFTFMLAVSNPFKGFSQQLACPYNIDWETGDTSGWSAQWGGPDPNGSSIVTQGPANPPPPAVPQTNIITPNSGFISGRHTIMNASMGNDPYGGFPVVSPSGGQYSIKIGDDAADNSADRVQYTFNVPPGVDNYSINFLYAVVLNDGGHLANQQPRFTLSVKDAVTGQPIKGGCYDLNFVANQNIPGFLLSPVGFDIYYKPWTRHTLNLSGTAGKTIILDIVAGDCYAVAHFGYGYFDVENCGEFKVSMIADSCNLDRGGVHLTGPEGFMTYEWYNNDYSVLVDTGQFVAFQPITTTPQIYHVVLTPFPSVSLCKDTIHTMHLANINIDKLDTTCILPNTPLTLNANIFGGSGPLTYEWTEAKALNSLSCTGCDIPSVTAPVSNYYTVKVTDTSGCHRSEIMHVGVNENTIDAIDDFVFCRPGYTQLDVNAAGPLPRTPVLCDTNSSATCTTPDTIEMRTMYREPFGNKEDTTTVSNPFAAQYTSARMQFVIRKEDMYASGMRYGSLSSLGFEVADPGDGSLNSFKISVACTDLSQIVGSFQQNMTPVYTALGATVPKKGWNDFTFNKPYNWDTSKNLLVEVCFTNLIRKTPARIITVNTGATDAIVGYTTVNNGNVCANGITNGLKFYTGRPAMRVSFCPSPDAPFAYTWMPGLFLQDSTIKSPIAYVNKTIEYHVNSIGGSDCTVEDSVTITVPIHDYYISPKDTSVCYGESFSILAGGTPASVQWYEYDKVNNVFTLPTNFTCKGCPDATKEQNPEVTKPTDTATYAVEYTDQYGCKDTFFVNAVVRPLPPVHILNDDTTLKYGQSIQLLASGAYLYSWSPLSTLTNPNLANPHVAPTEPTTFYVWGLSEDGCRNIDSVRINIDYRDNLFVPSAFTPNGDGKNDLFRISNLTFQKLQEFRVFNRWGQEIYSTNDPKKGWDGSWKGVPQDMGTYQYLIKVAYPDGYIETYKGDVSLIR